MSEIEIVRQINQFGSNTFIDQVTNIICNQLFLIILWLVLIILALIYDKKNGRILFFAIIFGLILHFLISEGFFKYILPDIFGTFRVRPWIEFPDIKTIGNLAYDSSFPSSHMSIIAMMLTIFISFYKKYWPLALVFLLMMTFARIHNGMHYPTDVLGGAILGILYGLTGIFVAKKILRN